MSELKSIYSCILDALDENGELPSAFSLPRESDEDGWFSMMWEDGAQDGVAIYHVMWEGSSKETLADFDTALKMASAGDFDAAEAALQRAGKRDGAYNSGLDLQQSFDQKSHADEVEAYMILTFAMHLLIDSHDRECVKYGIYLIGMFDHVQKSRSLRSVLGVLARSDEFTYYAAAVVCNWPGGNEMVFDFAQHVHGWGRIHCVSCLEPETEEIRKWLLTEGYHNHVLEQYSARTCFVKYGAEQLAREAMTPEEFTAVGNILSVMVCEDGPFPGLGGMEEPYKFLSDWLDRAEEMPLGLRDYQNLLTLSAYCRSSKGTLSEDYSSEEDKAFRLWFGVRFDMLLNTQAARGKVKAALAQGDDSVIPMAKYLQIR